MPRHHMFLGVRHGQHSYVADVGFGGLTLTAPVLFETGVEQETPHEAVRMGTRGGKHVIEVNLDGRWTGLYSFEVQDEVMPDFETANFYLANCPDSIFRRGLMAAKAGEGYRLTLRGRRLTRRAINKPVEVRDLNSPADLLEVMKGEFGIRLTCEEERQLVALVPCAQEGPLDHARAPWALSS